MWLRTDHQQCLASGPIYYCETLILGMSDFLSFRHNLRLLLGSLYESYWSKRNHLGVSGVWVAVTLCTPTCWVSWGNS